VLNLISCTPKCDCVPLNKLSSSWLWMKFWDCNWQNHTKDMFILGLLVLSYQVQLSRFSVKWHYGMLVLAKWRIVAWFIYFFPHKTFTFDTFFKIAWRLLVTQFNGSLWSFWGSLKWHQMQLLRGSGSRRRCYRMRTVRRSQPLFTGTSRDLKACMLGNALIVHKQAHMH